MAATAEGRRYCFHPYRMKRRWRHADDRRDRAGRAADRTVGSTETRRRWFELLWRVLDLGEIIRVRHTRYDEPAFLVGESRWRELERRASGKAPARQESS